MTANDITKVVSHYQTYHPRSQAGVEMGEERRLIGKRLRNKYTVEQLMLAIDGCHVSPFHCGKGTGSDGSKHQSLELIVRDAKHVDMFMARAAEAKAREAQPQAAEKATALRRQAKKDSEAELELRLALEHKWGGWFDGLGDMRLAELVQKAVPDSLLRAAMPRNMLRHSCLEYLEREAAT